MKYAVPPGSARITLLIALAARYTGCPASDWDGLDGLDTHPAFQISGRFGYSFGKTRMETILARAGDWDGDQVTGQEVVKLLADLDIEYRYNVHDRELWPAVFQLV